MSRQVNLPSSASSFDVAALQALFAIQEHEVSLIGHDALWISNSMHQIQGLPDDPHTVTALMAAAFQIQRIYTGLEEVIKSIVGKLDHLLPDGNSSHYELLKQARADTNVRPALLDESTFQLMDKLRSFRHFTRHNYGAKLDQARIIEISQTTIDCLASFKKCWHDFQKEVLPAILPPSTSFPKAGP